MNHPAKIELLAPARDVAIGIDAIDHGADAVYIGAPSHGARAAATNSLDDISRLTDYAHRFNVRVYATVNTLVYEKELIEVERMIRGLYRAGVDALIVQDLSVLRLDIPPIDLHASTQCDIRTPERARFLASCGFSQLVLPRELSIDETAGIRHALDTMDPSRGYVALEAFVHGALCVSYSGACNAGFATSGRSANRGECPQLCRLPYDLSDMSGKLLVSGKHLLSLRDLNRTASIADMIEAGVTSFKIEGRLKDSAYVRNVVAHYRRELDRIIDSGRLKRSSSGKSEFHFDPDVRKSFNRGFTEYFTNGVSQLSGIRMASPDSPKWIGECVGTVKNIKGNIIYARLNSQLNNGDGLGYFDATGSFCGFRLNRIEGDRLFSASVTKGLKPGMTLYRNRDKKRDDMMTGITAVRTLNLDMTLKVTPEGFICLEGEDERGCRATVVSEDMIQPDMAQRPQEDARRKALCKTGDTIYRIGNITDLAGNLFIPLSVLTRLRRDLTDLMDKTARITYNYVYRRQEQKGQHFDQSAGLSANISNSVSRSVYADHSLGSAPVSFETAEGIDRENDILVMTTRYCLRRELGECMRLPHSKRRFPDGSLMLAASEGNGRVRFKVDFDCARCGMNIWLPSNNAVRKK